MIVNKSPSWHIVPLVLWTLNRQVDMYAEALYLKTKISKKTDLKKFDYIDVKKNYSGEHIWNLIKATNFKNHGFYIKIGSKKIKIISKIKL